MKKEMDFDFDSMEIEYDIKTAIIMYDEQDELIQRFEVSNLTNMLIDYEKKVLHAEHINGKVYDIDFYKMIII